MVELLYRIKNCSGFDYGPHLDVGLVFREDEGG